MLKKLKNDKKGFTLVELIVVLVILAILAALLVPALTGYIDKAKEKSIIAETRSVVMAMQTLSDEEYGKAAVGADTVKYDSRYTTTTTDGETYIGSTNIKTLAEVNGTITSATITDGKVTAVTYQNKGKQCEYTAAKAATGTTSATEATYEVEDIPSGN